MLFRHEFLDGIRRGAITLAFRRWRRPSVRSGGTLLTAVGQLSIRSVTRINPDDISSAEARRAGYPSRETLLRELNSRIEGEVYRIELGPLCEDPRIALRESVAMDDAELRELQGRLDRLDAHTPHGPWTTAALKAIGSHPGLRAVELCKLVGQEKDEFKLNIRKLKRLGLTESLETGYRLSPRGKALLERKNDAVAQFLSFKS